MRGMRTSTIRGYMSAIAYMHTKDDFDDPTDCPSIKMALQGAQIREPSSGRGELQPINKQLLHSILDCAPFLVDNQYDRFLIKALFLTTYYACLRAGEIVTSVKTDHTLTLSQIVKHKSSYGIRFESYKHSKSCKDSADSNSRLPLYIVSSVPGSKYCPVVALYDFLKIRGKGAGPIFVDKHGKNIKRDLLAKWIKSGVELCNRSPANYNTHSIRIGRATQLADEGYSDEAIRTTGRWKSNAFKKYIRRSEFVLPL